MGGKVEDFAAPEKTARYRKSLRGRGETGNLLTCGQQFATKKNRTTHGTKKKEALIATS